MKILVPVKRVVDANIKVKLGADGTLDVSSLKKSMNPFDEIALEQAVQMKEKGIAHEVIAVSVGEAQCAETLRVALAMGADKAVLLQTSQAYELEPLNVAKILAAYVNQSTPDLIICGKQAVEMKEGRLVVTREVDGGFEVVELTLPAVVTADLRLNAPRYVTLPMMMKAKRKPQEVIEAASLGVQLRARTEVVGYEAPAARKVGQRVASVDELIDKLKNEAKVL